MQDLYDRQLPGLRFDPARAATEQFVTPQMTCFWKLVLVAVKIWLLWQRPGHRGFIGAEPFINGVASLVRHRQSGPSEYSYLG